MSKEDKKNRILSRAFDYKLLGHDFYTFNGDEIKAYSNFRAGKCAVHGMISMVIHYLYSIGITNPDDIRKHIRRYGVLLCYYAYKQTSRIKDNKKNLLNSDLDNIIEKGIYPLRLQGDNPFIKIYNMNKTSSLSDHYDDIKKSIYNSVEPGENISKLIDTIYSILSNDYDFFLYDDLTSFANKTEKKRYDIDIARALNEINSYKSFTFSIEDEDSFNKNLNDNANVTSSIIYMGYLINSYFRNNKYSKIESLYDETQDKNFTLNYFKFIVNGEIDLTKIEAFTFIYNGVIYRMDKGEIKNI